MNEPPDAHPIPPAAENPTIIAEARTNLPLLAGLVALCLALVAVAHYGRLDLALSHYDTKGHLVVARRIFDSLNPGWVQIGAVWLPLPHLLNALPVQLDVLYRTGASAIAVSVLSYALTVTLLCAIVVRATGSRLAGAVGVLVFALSPDVLYLQATPMTEALLMVLLSASVWLTIPALQAPTPTRVRVAGLACAAAVLTRYEAWPFLAALLSLGALGLVSLHLPLRHVVRRAWQVGRYPAWAVAAFLALGRASTGSWFTTSGFFIPENVATGRPLKAVLSAWWGAHELTSYAIASLALAGLCLAPVIGWRRAPRRLALLLPLSLAAVAALPAYAFYSGHPFRIRYMVALLPAMAIGLGVIVGAWSHVRLRVVAAVVVCASLWSAHGPFDPQAPMVLEAQWDRPNRVARGAITRYLRAHWDHELVLASMGSLAHYMQELSEAGFALRDFVHEGNGELWDAASADPGRHVEWVLVEEQSEGGDVLAQRARTHHGFFAGFARVAEGGGVALYRRVRSGT